MVTAGEFHWPVRVYYEDTDSGNVVYYANYLKFMERARTEWLREMGFEQKTLASAEGLVFAVRHAELNYLRPARLDDLLKVGVQVVRCRRASIEFVQTVILAQGEVVCRGNIKLASLDADTFKPRAIPSRMLETVRRYISVTREHHRK